MKLQLDTTAKTVKIENDIKVSALIKTLKGLLPKDWKDFTLQTNVTINNWSNPIYIERWVNPPVQPTYPWYGDSPSYTISFSDSPTLKSGTYNVEVK